MLATAGAASAATGLSWSAPASVDHHAPYGSAYELSGVSCPSVSLCVAAGQAGTIEWSANPAAGARSWRSAQVDETTRATPPSTIDDVSCPSASLCVAVDSSGHALISQRPTAGSSAWRTVRIDGSTAMGSVSCPSSALCVAIDSAGRAITSTDPRDPAHPWKAVPVASGITSLSCPSASLCVAVTNSGGVAVSTDPARRAPSWSFTPLVAAGPILGLTPIPAVSCPSVSFCLVGVGTALLYSVRPAGGAGAWHVSYEIPGFSPVTFNGVSCTAANFCVAFNTGGGVATTADATAGQSAWTVAPFNDLGPATGTVDVSCASPVLCAGVNDTQVLTSTRPSAATDAWAVGTPPNGYNSIDQVVCPTRTLCLAIDNAGNMLRSASPSSGARTWKLTHLDTTALAYLSCPSAKLCVSVDQAGKVLSSTHPSAGRGAWSRSGAFPSGSDADAGGVSGLACPAISLCVVLAGGTGDIAVSTDPGAGASSWRVHHVDSSSLPCGYHSSEVCAGTLTAVSCASRSFCVVVDSNGNAVVSTDPGGGASAWRPMSIDPDADPEQGYEPLQFVSCPGTSLCAAGDFGGNVVASRNPAATAPVWELAAVTSAYASLDDLTCPSITLCIGIDDNGKLVAASDPAGAAGGWKTFGVGLTPAGLEATPLTPGEVRCPSSSFCAASAGDRVATSTDPAGGARAWTARTVDSQGITALACPSGTTCIAADAVGGLATGTVR